MVLSELGSESNPNNANVAKVKFTVRTAGQYKISVMIGSTHIAGSPFVRNFLPGEIEPSKSRLVRPANTVVCCASAATLLYIEPRDEFGNGCTFKREIDAIRVRLFFSNDIQFFTQVHCNLYLYFFSGLSSESVRYERCKR